MKPSYTAVGVIGLALGGLWYAGGGTAPPAAAAAGPLRVADPVSHENLAVFLVHGPDAVDDSRVVPLQEALDRKWAVVHETGEVNQLAVENLSSDHELFVQSGDIIKGGRQDRLFASDLLVPPGSGRVPVRVHCVEHGRWSGRPNEAAAYFASSPGFAVGNDIKLANASYDQSGVWEKVKENQDKLSKNVGVQVNAAASPTSLQLALENPAVRAKAEAYRAALAAAGQRRGVVGAVFVVNGKVTSAEVYGSNGLFRKAWPKLLKAASEEALAEKADGPAAAPPSAREVEAFLATAANEESGEHSSPGRGGVTDPIAFEIQFAGRAGATRSQLLRAGAGQFAELHNNDFNAWTLGHRVEMDRSNPTQQAGAGQLPAALLTNPHDSIVPNANPTNTFAAPGLPNVQGPAPNPPPSGNRGGGTADVIREVAELQSGHNRAPVNPAGNRLNTNRVENRAAVVVESKDAGNRVVHRSYIKK